MRSMVTALLLLTTVACKWWQSNIIFLFISFYCF
jgi:hypothetical protein